MNDMSRIGWIVGLDIGGTFTDVYMLEPDSGRTARFKSLTTTDDPARGAGSEPDRSVHQTYQW